FPDNLVPHPDPLPMTMTPARRWLLALAALGLASRLTAADSPVPDDWAFKKPTRPAVPAVAGKESVRTPVDAFLLAKLEAAKLTFAPPADKRTLLRLATVDLTS